MVSFKFENTEWLDPLSMSPKIDPLRVLIIKPRNNTYYPLN